MPRATNPSLMHSRCFYEGLQKPGPPHTLGTALRAFREPQKKVFLLQSKEENELLRLNLVFVFISMSPLKYDCYYGEWEKGPRKTEHLGPQRPSWVQPVQAPGPGAHRSLPSAHSLDPPLQGFHVKSSRLPLPSSPAHPHRDRALGLLPWLPHACSLPLPWEIARIKRKCLRILQNTPLKKKRKKETLAAQKIYFLKHGSNPCPCSENPES